ncbi:MAG: hypothetical protein E6H07_16545 [Bacteroidetes bacterium]|nr:MAG: hypothetical protein E6H07_16545 [Bacteroidota bacterium]
MKKSFFILLFSILAINSFSQNTFFKAVKLYYRVNPFDRKFSAVLTSILGDTSFVKKDFIKRTDSNFFFLSGHYKRFNPFDFAVTQTQLRIAETEIFFSDSVNSSDTILIYQVLGLAGPGEEAKAKVQKELSKFHKRFNYDFDRSDFKESVNNNMVTAAIINYYFFGRSIPAMSAAWGKIPGENTYTFTVSIRLKVTENFADLPKTPNEF